MSGNSITLCSTAASRENVNSSSLDLLPCSEDFFREEGSKFCVPSCYTWHEFSETEVTVSDVIIGLSAVVGILSSFVVFAVSLTKPKQM